MSTFSVAALRKQLSPAQWRTAEGFAKRAGDGEQMAVALWLLGFLSLEALGAALAGDGIQELPVHSRPDNTDKTIHKIV